MTTEVKEKALGDGVEGRGDHGILHRFSSVKATPLEFFIKEEGRGRREYKRREKESKRGKGMGNSEQ